MRGGHRPLKFRRYAQVVGLLVAGACLLLLPDDIRAADPTAPPVGPPFPRPEVNRAVYDFAGVFSASTIAYLERKIDRIEERTGAEVVVYTQVVPFAYAEATAAHARALMDQWGVGRRGLNDGLAILFDFDPGRSSGHVHLVAGDGFAAAYMSDAERQRIFEEEMLPHLRDDDWDGAIEAAMQEIDANATPERAAELEFDRQVNAVVGLVGAPLVFALIVGTALFWWRRYGKDPVYLDSPSIYLPAPPSGLTPASAAVVMEGVVTRRALTAAMLDLASRGLIAFRERERTLRSRRVAIELDPHTDDEAVRAQRERNGRFPLGGAEQLAMSELWSLSRNRLIEPDDLAQFGYRVGKFNDALDHHVVTMGWFTERPNKVRIQWATKAVTFLLLGVGGTFLGIWIPMSGLVLVGIGTFLAGGVVLVMSRFMPAVTLPGAVMRAQLAAYRRTLKKTMEQSHSIEQVAADAGVDWLDTPDLVIVWGTALGLDKDIEAVFRRSLKDVGDGRGAADVPYFPSWFSGSVGGDLAAPGGGSAFSGSAMPNVVGMISVLGTIGDGPSPLSGDAGGIGGDFGGGFGGGDAGGAF